MITKTNAFLLKKNSVASGGFFLCFFSEVFGKISVFLRSQKKAEKIDFFCFYQLEIKEFRNKKTLKTIEESWFCRNFLQTYTASSIGFLWLKKIDTEFPEEKPSEEAFCFFYNMFLHFSEENGEMFDLFFQVRERVFSGMFPRIKNPKTQKYFCPNTFAFEETSSGNSYFVELASRKIIYFFQTTSFADFLDTFSQIPKKYLLDVASVLQTIDTEFQKKF